MKFTLKWMDSQIADYYASGGIFHQDFDTVKLKEVLEVIKNELEVFVEFEGVKSAFIIKNIVFKRPSHDFYYELDDGLLELLEAQQDNAEILEIVGVLALQHYEFDILKDVLELSQEDIDSLDKEEKEITLLMKEQLETMDEKEKELFLEQEMLFYTQEELEYSFASLK